MTLYPGTDDDTLLEEWNLRDPRDDTSAKILEEMAAERRIQARHHIRKAIWELQGEYDPVRVRDILEAMPGLIP